MQARPPAPTQRFSLAVDLHLPGQRWLRLTGGQRAWAHGCLGGERAQSQRHQKACGHPSLPEPQALSGCPPRSSPGAPPSQHEQGPGTMEPFPPEISLLSRRASCLRAVSPFLSCPPLSMPWRLPPFFRLSLCALAVSIEDIQEVRMGHREEHRRRGPLGPPGPRGGRRALPASSETRRRALGLDCPSPARHGCAGRSPLPAGSRGRGGLAG